MTAGLRAGRCWSGEHCFEARKERYGSKRIHRDLRADGERVSERHVARILRENILSSRRQTCCSGRFTAPTRTPSG
ncbi:IS3 family transposase [Palleronia caenipelagi]